MSPPNAKLMMSTMAPEAEDKEKPMDCDFFPFFVHMPLCPDVLFSVHISNFSIWLLDLLMLSLGVNIGSSASLGLQHETGRSHYFSRVILSTINLIQVCKRAKLLTPPSMNNVTFELWKQKSRRIFKISFLLSGEK